MTAKRQDGFTLLEVLVAMALIGMVFVGIGAIQKQLSNTQYHLEERLAAAQLASNLLEIFRAEGLPPDPQHLIGAEEMGGRLLSWVRQITPTDDGKGYEVRIQVGSGITPLFEETLLWTPRSKPE
ncbi:MAG: type II secretion system minor pseudopilin GspI [Magnetococcus sp. DMHC-1]|nr:type II secretion system minor pseudopilin GspI [Magnetococcales bacterium]